MVWVLLGLGVPFVACVVAVVLESRKAARAAIETRDLLRGILQEVVTGNALTIGQLGEATETRRVEGVPPDERTAQEQRHLDESPELGPPQGPDPFV